jgi:hypothetical protein
MINQTQASFSLIINIKLLWYSRAKLNQLGHVHPFLEPHRKKINYNVVKKNYYD